MTSDLNNLFEIKHRDDAKNNPAESKKALTRFIVKLLSTPVLLIMGLFILYVIFQYSSYMNSWYENILWLFALLSVISSLACIIFGIYQWHYLTLNYKIIIILHAVLCGSLLLGILFLIWAFAHAPMKF
jgi:hypothetical protein